MSAIDSIVIGLAITIVLVATVEGTTYYHVKVVESDIKATEISYKMAELGYEQTYEAGSKMWKKGKQ